MSKFSFSYSDDSVVILDGQNKAEPCNLLDVMDDSDAINAIGKEQTASVAASQGAISLLSKMLNNPKFDGYKGITPHNEKIPAEFRGALRDVETEYMKPIFVERLLKRGNTSAYAEKAWQEYVAGLRTGSYANAKSHVSKLFAHCGQLPTAPNGKLLPLRAIMKICENAKADTETPKANGIAGKLVSLSADIANRTEKTDLGDIKTAIAALKVMLATYEGLQRESDAAATNALMGLNQAANAAIANAQAVVADTEDSLTTLWENGQLTDDEFQARMTAIGVDVDIVDPMQVPATL